MCFAAATALEKEKMMKAIQPHYLDATCFVCKTPVTRENE